MAVRLSSLTIPPQRLQDFIVGTPRKIGKPYPKNSSDIVTTSALLFSGEASLCKNHKFQI